MDSGLAASRRPGMTIHRRKHTSCPRSAAAFPVSKRAPRSPGARSTSTTCASPACCTARSSAARSRMAASRASTRSAARALAGVHAVITGEDIRAVMPDPYYGPAFHDQPILALDKVRYVGEPVAVVLAADPHVAERAAQLIEAEYDELPAVYDEVEALSPDRDRARRAEARRHVPRPEASGRAEEHQRRARLSAAPRRCRGRDGGGRSRARAHIQDPAGACTCRSSRSSRSPSPAEAGSTIHTASQTPSFVRIEIARLLGWPENARAREGAASSAAASAPRSTSSSRRWSRRWR